MKLSEFAKRQQKPVVKEIKADRTDDPSFKNAQTFGRIPTPTIKNIVPKVVAPAPVIPSPAEISRDKGNPTLKQFVQQENAKIASVENKKVKDTNKEIRSTATDRTKMLERQIKDKYGIDVEKRGKPFQVAQAIKEAGLTDEQKKRLAKDLMEYETTKVESSSLKQAETSFVKGFSPVLTTDLESKYLDDDTNYKQALQTPVSKVANVTGNLAKFAALYGIGGGAVAGEVIPTAGGVGAATGSLNTTLMQQLAYGAGSGTAGVIGGELIKDLTIGAGIGTSEALQQGQRGEELAKTVAQNILTDIGFNIGGAVIGKTFKSIADASKAAKLSKTAQMVDDLAIKANISPEEASKVIDAQIDFYVNQSGIADTKQFDQLQLEAPKTKDLSDVSNTLSSKLRAKQSDLYVNQFGVANNKPFEQLQLEAPVRTNSDASVSRLSEKVKAIQKPAVIEEPTLIIDKPIDKPIIKKPAVAKKYTESELKNIQYELRVGDRYKLSDEDLNAYKKYAEEQLKKSNNLETVDIKKYQEEVNFKIEDARRDKIAIEQGKINREKEMMDSANKTIDLYKKLENLGYSHSSLARKSNKELEEIYEVSKTVIPNQKVITPWGEKLTVDGITGNGLIKAKNNNGEQVNLYLDQFKNSEKLEVTAVKPQLDRPSEFSIGAKYPPLAKSFAREVPKPARPRIEPMLKPIDRPSDFSVKKPVYPTLDPKFAKERPSVISASDVKRIEPTLKPIEQTVNKLVGTVDNIKSNPIKTEVWYEGSKLYDPQTFKVVPNFYKDGEYIAHNYYGKHTDAAKEFEKTDIYKKIVDSIKNKQIEPTLNVASKVDQPTTTMKIEPTLKQRADNVASKFENQPLETGDDVLNNGEIKERGFSENIRTDANRVDEVRKELDDNPEFYEVLGNKDTLASAQARFDRGYDEALQDFERTKSTLRADNVPFAKLLADEAAKRGDMNTARRIIVDVAENLTTAGQYSQAAKILRESNDPITVLRFVQKELDKLNKTGSTRYGKKWNKIDLTDTELDTINKLGKDATDEQKEQLFESLFESVSTRIPTTNREKFDAWRRIAMLFNPKTHVRNTLGNALMTGVKKVSDKVAQGLELTLPKEIRTKGNVTKELKAVSNDYFNKNKKQLMEGSRWEIFGVKSPFADKPIFKTGWLNTLDDVSKRTLEAEDIMFFKKNFTDDLASFMNTRGLKEQTQEAIDYATRRAQEATFRQANKLAEAINKMKGSRYGLLVDAAIPFTKTPANILATGIDYSPIGAIKGAITLINNADPAKAIETLSKGLTGTSLSLLGYYMGMNGLARGEYEKSAKVEGLYQATGQLPNSIKTGKGSYTIDWAQPLSMPFFMGVAFAESLKKQSDDKAQAVFDALIAGGETLVKQSMLRGISDLFGGYGSTTEKIVQLPINYMTQGFPTVFGQIARVIDPSKRQADYSTVASKTITPLISRTPIVSTTLPEKFGILGEPQKYGKGLLNAFQQFLSPGFIGQPSENPLAQEIDRLYKEVGSDFLPKYNVSSFQSLGEQYKLSGTERSELQRIMGEYTAEQLSKMVETYVYRSATDEQKAEMIKKANETGYKLAKESIVKARGGK